MISQLELPALTPDAIDEYRRTGYILRSVFSQAPYAEHFACLRCADEA
jgi:hypothetical protein